MGRETRGSCAVGDEGFIDDLNGDEFVRDRAEGADHDQLWQQSGNEEQNDFMVSKTVKCLLHIVSNLVLDRIQALTAAVIALID